MGLVSLSGLLLLACSTIASGSGNLVNEKVVSYIDISSQLAKIKQKITVVNDGSEPVSSYTYVVDPVMKNDLSYIEAVDNLENSLVLNKFATNDSSVNFEVMFSSSLFPGDAETIDIYSVFTNSFQTFPKTVKQHEKHLVIFRFNVFYYSAYFTEMQTLILNAGSIDVNTVSGEAYRLADRVKEGLQYGPYYDQQPEAVLNTDIHFETKSPFLTVKTLERFIQLSHWGYVKVRDQVSLIHTGPKLTGPYERSYPKGDENTKIESFMASLPEYAFDIYLHDEIGFIYSFDIDYDNPDRVDVLIKPRFVLYGGWKTQFEIVYSLPTKYYLSHDNTNDLYSIFIPLVNRLYLNMIVEEAKVNVVLPEGAIYVDINPYYKIENDTKKKYCYFMDTTCREIVSFTVENLVDEHSLSIFQITYSFRQIQLLSKPLIFTAFIYTVLLIFLIISRFSQSGRTREINKPASHVFQIHPVSSVTNRKKQEEPIEAKHVPQKKEAKQRKKQQKQINREKSKKR